MFKRVLIANRGEIAVRVIRACQELDIETVAIYSEADANALHVQLADRSVNVGPADATESYLNKAAILKAARETHADAIHPGYGFLSEDADFAEEAKRLEDELPGVEEKLRTALIPRDPDDARDTIMEIKAGTGGEEAALFAGDLLRMYTRYAEKRGWSVNVQSENTTELGGVKDVQIAIRAKGTPAPEDGVWASLKYEGGVHRVQRIPVTESQGRIQTSAAGVIVFPEADEDDDEIEIDPKDLKIDIFMSSGPGGQSVNTTYSAVRMTHIPTGITVNMQDEKSQIQNRAAALRVLKSRLLAMKHEQEAAEAADMRHSQVRSLDRSERIRTYNFPENRIVDHRTNYKAYNLDAVLDGDLQAVIDSDIQADEADRLANQK